MPHVLVDGKSFVRSALLPDSDIQRVYRFYDSTQPHSAWPMAYGGVGKGHNDGRHRVVIELVGPNAKHARFSNAPAPPDGAGGSPIG